MSYFDRFPSMVYDMKNDGNFSYYQISLDVSSRETPSKTVNSYLTHMMLEMVKNLKM